MLIDILSVGLHGGYIVVQGEQRMAKVKFTAGRIESYQCEVGTSQSFLWDATAPGLGLRATASGAKSFIFQAKIAGKAIRITIGSPATWEISAAQAEARRLKVLIDIGHDPRQVRSDALADRRAAQVAVEAAAVRDSITLAEVWKLYVAERSPHWGERHAADHAKMIAPGGIPRTRAKKKLTEAAPLASLVNLRLVDLTPQAIEAWAKTEAARRPTSARLALRMLKACLNWCAAHPTFATVVTINAAQSKKARECLGRPKVKDDVLQREQLPAWFCAVRQLPNSVTSAYLQCLLLSGARREEMGRLKWEDVDFQWKSMTIRDKVDGTRTIPLTPYMAHLLATLPRRNEWVFSSLTASSGRLADPTKPHNQACTNAGLELSLHGLRRSFATLSEWTETPSGIAAQIQGHKPQGIREQNYIRRPLDLLRMWHIKIEEWVLREAKVEILPVRHGLAIVSSY